MTMQLRYYQSDLLAAVDHQWSAGRRRVLMMAPTGAGKTLPLAEAIRRHRGVSCAIAHRDNLVIQLSLTLAAQGVRHRIIASQKTQRAAAALQARKLGRTYIDPGARCAVASAQTLVKRDELTRWCATVTLWVVDEGHHLTKGSVWGKCVERFTHPECCGLIPTATPGRADGKGLGSHHDGYADVMAALVEDGDKLAVRVAMPQESITCAPAKVLMDQGFLTRYKVAIAQTHLERFLGEVGPSGDWTPAALKKAAAQTNMVGDVVESYKQFAMGLTAIVFARDVEEAGNIAKAYRAEGITAEVLTGETDPAVRMSIFARLESGALKVVVAVDVISEGTDIPAVGAIIFARATASLGLFLQMVGRGLRPAPGKQNCIARGTPILTQRGPVPIEDIALTDRVWDGIDFVSHKGAICNGVRPTITYLGLTATPDHLVWTQEGWRTFGDCAREQIAIAQTGLGGETIRERENLFARGGVAQVETVRLLPVRDLLGREVASLHEPDGRSDKRLSSVQSAEAVPYVFLCEGAVGSAEMREPEQSFLPQLRRAGDQVQLPYGNGGGFVGSGQSGLPARRDGDRPYRQRWPLRAGEPSLVYAKSEHVASALPSGNREDARFPNEVPRSQVRGLDTSGNVFSWDDRRGNNREVFSDAIEQTEREVWDILDAGPRNRFTAQGLLVHNCVLIDHVGNVLRHRGGPDTPRTWSLSRRDKRAPAVRDAIPLRVCLNIDCMQPYEKHLDACPHCGQPAPEPERRGPPEVVEGVLALMDDETMARLRGEMPASVEEYSREMYASGLPGRFAGANVKRHRERLEVLGALRDAMAVWAGPRHAAGRSDAEIQREFWHVFQCDVFTAQTLSREDAEKLLTRVSDAI